MVKKPISRYCPFKAARVHYAGRYFGDSLPTLLLVTLHPPCHLLPPQRKSFC